MTITSPIPSHDIVEDFLTVDLPSWLDELQAAMRKTDEEFDELLDRC